MPEGDTVWRAARTLDRALSGTRVRADLRVPQLAETDLEGVVVETVARGKHLLTRIDSGVTLHTHLRMEGSWHLYRPGEHWRRPAHQARVVLTGLDGERWTAVGFSLGVVELLATADEGDAVGHLGPDLLGDGWDDDAHTDAVRRLGAPPDRALHSALLDQRNLAGVGNLYATELCFLAGVAPQRPVAEVPDLHRVVDRARRLLVTNRERPEQTTTGDLRSGRRTWVYDRGRRPCRRCATRVRTADLGPVGQERLVAWCPSCQPA